MKKKKFDFSEPLTLEQLCEMDSHPVWIEDLVHALNFAEDEKRRVAEKLLVGERYLPVLHF